MILLRGNVTAMRKIQLFDNDFLLLSTSNIITYAYIRTCVRAYVCACSSASVCVCD